MAPMVDINAQDNDHVYPVDAPFGLIADNSPNNGGLLPVQDNLSSDENLETEAGPAPGGIPVDGVLSLLLAAGAIYGEGRLKGRRDDIKNGV